MNYVDLFILIIVGFFTLKGLLKGMIKEVGGIVGLFLAFIIASTQIGKGADFLKSVFKINPGVSYILGFIALFLAVIIAVKILEGFLLKIFKLTSTEWIDKIGGGILGFLFGTLIIAVLIVLLTFVPFSGSLEREQDTSTLYPYAEFISKPLFNLSLRVNPGAKRLKSIIEEEIKGKIPEINLDKINR